jgi:hypothetical protein
LQPGDWNVRSPAGLLDVAAPPTSAACPGSLARPGVVVPHSQGIDGVAKAPSRGGLDAIGRRHGTELSSLGRDCLRHWERLLVSWREEPFDLLEIGVDSGASLRLWREWFPRARLVGLDVRRIWLDPPIAGCVILRGSQTDDAVLRRLARDYRFRLVLDDGSPYWDDKRLTFRTLFPWLEPDGAYVLAGSAALAPTTSDGHAAPGVAMASLDVTWFANLGVTVATSSQGVPPQAPQPHDQVASLATGVSLLPGSIVVTR